MLDHALEVIDRAAGIQDVFHQDGMQPLDAIIQILGQANLAGTARGLAITRHGDEVERNFQTNLSDKIGEENRRAFEDANQVQPFAPKIRSDLPAHLPHTTFDSPPPQQNSQPLGLTRRFHKTSRKSPDLCTRRFTYPGREGRYCIVGLRNAQEYVGR